MMKLSLDTTAGEFDMISSDTRRFYNTETGEFDFHNDFSGIDDGGNERFEENCWIAAPSQNDIGEYDILSDFADSITNPRKNEQLSVALNGRGAFWRFKDTVYHVGLADEWFAFKHQAYEKLAGEWCIENDIPYIATPLLCH
jgi:hypothetical protein